MATMFSPDDRFPVGADHTLDNSPLMTLDDWRALDTAPRVQPPPGIPRPSPMTEPNASPPALPSHPEWLKPVTNFWDVMVGPPPTGRTGLPPR